MIVETNKVVSIHYTLTNDDNNVLDQSSKEQPLVYLHGTGNIIPGLEEALAGKTSGDKLKTRIEPEHAYGIRQEGMVQTMPLDAFQGAEKIEPGMQFHAAGPNGENIVVTVTQIEDGQVIIDGNHPLSGVALTFDVEIADIREATAEEITHKHIHGAGCDHG
jgi:FKBP-type peptidyl-prolyl cis-trans isomerase SlyD